MVGFDTSSQSFQPRVRVSIASVTLFKMPWRCYGYMSRSRFGRRRFVLTPVATDAKGSSIFNGGAVMTNYNASQLMYAASCKAPFWAMKHRKPWTRTTRLMFQLFLDTTCLGSHAEKVMATVLGMNIFFMPYSQEKKGGRKEIRGYWRALVALCSLQCNASQHDQRTEGPRRSVVKSTQAMALRNGPSHTPVSLRLN